MSANGSLTLYDCVVVREILLISVSYTVAKVLLVLPVAVFVLQRGCRRWRRRRPRSFEASSTCDVFAFHVAAMELLSELGWAVLCCGAFARLTLAAAVGLNVFVLIFPGQTLFHVLTCLERYLAAVHPIAYRGLRRSGGVRLRNGCTGGVWLLCGGWCAVTYTFSSGLTLLFFCFFVLSLVVVTFCSVSVLRVLVRPGPGGAGRDGERLGQLKQKAFCTIVSIMAVLWLLFAGVLVCVGLTASPLLGFRAWCVVVVSTVWFNVPGSLVLLLLFVHRAGAFARCRSRPR